MKSRILFLYNAVAEEERHGHYGECMTFAQAAKIGQALVEGGHQVLHLNLRSPVQLEEFLRAHGPFTIAFCIAEGFLALPSTLFDGTGTPWVRKILEKRGVPATHTSVAGMEVCRNKDETYQALAANNIRVPAHFTIRPEAGSIDQQLKAIEEMLQFPPLCQTLRRGQQHRHFGKIHCEQSPGAGRAGVLPPGRFGRSAHPGGNLPAGSGIHHWYHWQRRKNGPPHPGLPPG